MCWRATSEHRMVSANLIDRQTEEKEREKEREKSSGPC